MSQLQEQAPSGAEQIVDVIGGLTRVSGFMGAKQKRYTLVVTDRRLIFAELTKEKVHQLTHDAKEHAREEGRGAWGRLGEQMKVPWTAAEACRRLSPEAVLAENPGNFAIDRTAVTKVKFKVGSTEAATETVVLRTTSGTHKLQVGGSLRHVKEVLARAGIA
jgi:hypothetical protein